jgi:Alkyl sulfatase dimerisation
MAIERPCTSFLSVMPRQNTSSLWAVQTRSSKGEKSFDAGDYRWVAQVVNHVVFADPSNKAPPSPYWSHVIFWHLADIDACAEHVRFEE